MLNLRHAMEDYGVNNRTLSAALDVAPSTVSTLANHGRFPKHRDETTAKEIIRGVFKEKGASAATLAVLFDESTTATAANKPKDEYMLLRKQPLYPATRKHFGLFQDPWGEITNAEHIFDTSDIKYVRISLQQTLTSERFIAVVGESGAGKSTLRRELADKVIREDLPVIIIEPYVLGLEDNDKKGRTLKSQDLAAAIIRTVAALATLASSAEGRFNQLHQVLRDSRRAGHRHVLMIEEAHALPIPTLKHLKRFYELEDGMNKLLSIVLIGQPELAAKLTERNLQVREVVQRLEMITLEPLDSNLEEYVAHRLKLAGKSTAEVFEPGALDALRDKLTVPSRHKDAPAVSLLYPLAVGNQITAAMNKTAEIGAPRITKDIIRIV